MTKRKHSIVTSTVAVSEHIKSVNAIHGAVRTKTALIISVATLLLVVGVATLDTNWSRVFNGFGELGRIFLLMMPPDYGSAARLTSWSQALVETIAIAFLGTCGAAILALPFSFLAARNVVPTAFIRFPIRRFLDSIRGVDTLIWALIWINVVGLGPFAGVLAIMTSDFGLFAKLFSEAVEATDGRAAEGVIASGGNAVHRVAFGLLPQVLPVMLSQVLYYFESNTRSATIIGIVGAGGIGLHLSEMIRTLEWQHVAFIVLMILVTVAVIDAISACLRYRLIGGQAPVGGAKS
jgi:phosphonate transport system permease protein